jgi:hydrogenase small subunit
MQLMKLPWLKPEKPIPLDVHVIWLPDGMSCDGDTVSVTAAEQPPIEDLILGNIPGIPKVVLHNRVLAYEQGGDTFMDWLYKAEKGKLEPFVLVIEGSIPNEKIKKEG